ncbi:MAG: carbohydrate binding domain-containing protein, partial [Firmicutes bacterium]|nr:carbohydrate binding domain-containing protein [Bacillota bacterium]
NNNNNNNSSSSSATQPNSYGWYFDSTFENGTDGWAGRGAASTASNSSQHYVGSKSLYVSGRTATWNGAYKSLDTATYVPGNQYSFSANIKYTSGNSTEPFYLKLQYTSGGTTHYATIAEAKANKGSWTQLANKNFAIPSGANNMQLYVETGSSTCDFYMDEAIVAKAGTSISGAGGGSSSNTSNNNTNNNNNNSSSSTNGQWKSKSWNFSDSQFNGLRTLSSNVTVDGITILANSSKTVSVPSSPQTLNGTTYKYCLALGGGGSTSYRAVKIPVSGSTVLKVTAKSTGSDTRTLVAVNDSGQQIGSINVDGTLATGQITVNGNGNVYLYSTRNGINIYKLQMDTTGSIN